MPKLLEQLQADLKIVFKQYDDLHHTLVSVLNAGCITRLRTINENAKCAFEILSTLPNEVDKLDTKFWSFLPFINDPIHDSPIQQ